MVGRKVGGGSRGEDIFVLSDWSIRFTPVRNETPTAGRADAQLIASTRKQLRVSKYTRECVRGTLEAWGCLRRMLSIWWEKSMPLVAIQVSHSLPPTCQIKVKS